MSYHPPDEPPPRKPNRKERRRKAALKRQRPAPSPRQGPPLSGPVGGTGEEAMTALKARAVALAGGQDAWNALEGEQRLSVLHKVLQGGARAQGMEALSRLLELNERDGVVAPTPEQAVEETRRLRRPSEAPALQRLPLRTEEARELREAFKLPPLDLPIDYAELELRTAQATPPATSMDPGIPFDFSSLAKAIRKEKP